ncbi:MAG: hypothetical protein CL992_03655 [Euryarchaeota archaeon]|nr:hypothetical protein [Euryarchaeota archaeon]
MNKDGASLSRFAYSTTVTLSKGLWPNTVSAKPRCYAKHLDTLLIESFVKPCETGLLLAIVHRTGLVGLQQRSHAAYLNGLSTKGIDIRRMPSRGCCEQWIIRFCQVCSQAVGTMTCIMGPDMSLIGQESRSMALQM